MITRLGLKPDTTREDMLAALQKFGEDDSLYDLLTVYDIKPWETWTIPTHVVHAPGQLHAPPLGPTAQPRQLMSGRLTTTPPTGPWLTFEIQKPQDDYNLLAWRLATRLEGEEKVKTKEDHQLRGLASEEAVLEETIKWDLNVDPAFEEKWVSVYMLNTIFPALILLQCLTSSPACSQHRTCEALESGSWGRRIQLFYGEFYGEGFELEPEKKVGVCWVDCLLARLLAHPRATRCHSIRARPTIGRMHAWCGAALATPMGGWVWVAIAFCFVVAHTLSLSRSIARSLALSL